MLFKSVILSALIANFSVAAQEISAADVVSNINRLMTLTRIGTSIVQDVVYVNNPIRDRNDTIVFINAIGTQATLDEDLMTGRACGALTKRYSGSITGRAMPGQRRNSTYTPQEQMKVTIAYTTLVDVTQDFAAACVEKHDAVVAHSAAHQMGQALNSTLGVLDTLTDTIITTVPTQTDIMTALKSFLDQSYSTTINLYVNGPS